MATSKRAEVMLKAAEVIQAKGFEATTVNDISRVTGLTKGGLYHYIKSKEDLLFQIMRFAMDAVRDHIVEPVSKIEDPEEQLRTLIRLHINLIAHGSGVLTILSEEVEGLTAAHRREILARKRDYFDFVRGMIVRLQAIGRLRALDPSVTAFNVFGVILFFARWYRPGGGALTPAQIADQMVDLIMNGMVLPRPAAGRGSSAPSPVSVTRQPSPARRRR